MVRKTFNEWLLELPAEISGDYFNLFSPKKRNTSLKIRGYGMNDKLTFQEFINAGIPLYALAHNKKWTELFRANPKNLEKIEEIFYKTKNQPKIELVW